MLVKLDHTVSFVIEGLAPNVVPIFPLERRYSIAAGRKDSVKTKSILRRQLPLTSSYAFTDYRSQGQTLDAVIIDLAKPPHGGLTPFNAYVALSRSSGRDTIRLLRGFNDDLFKKVPCHKLAADEERLIKDAEATKKWHIARQAQKLERLNRKSLPCLPVSVDSRVMIILRLE